MIPRKIHYFWFGNGEKSDLVKKCIASWKKYCPGYEITEWNENNYDVTKNDYIHQAYQAKRWGFVSDFARLDVIYQNGGIYLDTDVELIRPIDDLLVHDGFIGFEVPAKTEEANYTINTGQGFGAVAGSPVIKRMLEEYETLSFLYPDGSQNLTACPTYNTRALHSVGLRLDNTLQRIDNFVVYPTEYFCPVNWKTRKCTITPNTYSIHHFMASWLTSGEKRKRRFLRYVDYMTHVPNRCIKNILGAERYEKLKRKFGR